MEVVLIKNQNKFILLDSGSTEPFTAPRHDPSYDPINDPEDLINFQILTWD